MGRRGRRSLPRAPSATDFRPQRRRGRDRPSWPRRRRARPPRSAWVNLLREKGLQAEGQAWGELRQLLECEEDAVGERFAAGRVVADREQLSLPAEDDLLVRDEAGQA